MRSAERELLEIERKRQVADAPGGGNGGNKLKSAGDVVKERLSELTKQIADESKRLANTRSQLQKLKTTSTTSGTVLGTGTGVTVNAISGATTSAGIMKAFLGSGGGAAGAKDATAAAGAGAAPSKTSSKKVVIDALTGERVGHVGAVAAIVPEGSVPELCRYGRYVNRYVNKFILLFFFINSC